MKYKEIDTSEVEQVWDSMSDSQKEIFRLGFHIGRKLGLQEAQEAENPNLPKSTKREIIELLEENIGHGDLDGDSYLMDAIALIEENINE